MESIEREMSLLFVEGKGTHVLSVSFSVSAEVNTRNRFTPVSCLLVSTSLLHTTPCNVCAV